MSRSAGKARTQLSKKGGHMKSIAYSLLLLAILSGCGSTTESTGPSVHIGNVVQIGLHLNSKGEFVLDGQASVPLTPMDELVGASWDFAFETVLNKAKHKSNYLIVLWQDANGNIMEDDYPIGQPFQINFEHDQWVRRIERIGDGNIIVSVEKQAMAVQSLSTSLPPAPRPTKRVQPAASSRSASAIADSEATTGSTLKPVMNLMSSMAKTLVGSVMAMVSVEPTRESGTIW